MEIEIEDRKKEIPRKSGQQPKCSKGVLCSMQYAFWYRSRRKTRCEASHRVGAAHIAKTQSRLGRINRFVAAGCEIDKVTSAEIAFAIFIAKHNLPMAVGDEFGDVVNHSTSCAPWWWKNTNVRSVPLFHSLMLTPMVSPPVVRARSKC